MNLRTCRRSILAALLLLAAAGAVFYHRQNSGQHLGGGISLPKMLWLAYAVTAWFVMPLFLWRDARLDGSVRRLFGVFWAVMMARGVIELVMLYVFVHWHPWYGISHDLFCLVLLLWLRRRAEPDTMADRHALRFCGTLLVGLIAEAAFAAMFMQTGVHERATFFASNDASWQLVNYLTWVVLAFVYPDFIGTLVALYFPGCRGEAPRLLRGLRVAAGAFVVLAVTAGLVGWTWMLDLERKAKRFQTVGSQINRSCSQFKEAFKNADVAGMTDFVLGGDGSWRLERQPPSHRFELTVWKPGGPQRTLLDAFKTWRNRLPVVEQAAFKIHLLDEVVSDTEAVAQVRFEVTGERSTDYGLLRCRFQLGEDKRWRVSESSLIEGTTVEGSGREFVDLAAERGVDFVVRPDKRFVPGESCTQHRCQPVSELRFQMMRFAYAGCSVGDFDGDGYDDVFFCSGSRPALYRNRGDGSFQDVTEEAGLGDLWHINTAGFADLDNDGDQDLYLAAFYGPNYVFQNNGDGTFRDVTSRTGLGQDDMVACFAFFDYDNDGDLDLYLGRPLDARKNIPDSFLYTRNAEANILYRNDGDFQFTDVTAFAGVGDHGMTLSLAAADYDLDGDQDLYLANDFGRNVLYQNQGDGTFRDIAAETGSLAIGGSMSASWGDYDNDGRLDLYVGAIRSNQRWFVQPITARRVYLKFIREGRFLATNPLFRDLHDRMGDDWLNIGNHALAGNSLLRQDGNGAFTDEADAAGARPAGWYWSCGFFDVDNDADLDIYATNGWITGEDPHDL